MSAATAYLALGSNLGDRLALIESALERLRRHPRIEVVAVSSIIETEPVGGDPGQNRYLNAATELRTTLWPRELLSECLAIEAEHGRDRTRQPRWGPRQIDLDILFYNSEVIDEPGLHIPHPRMAEREFVLQPLAQIAPGLVHPVLGVTIQTLLHRLRTSIPVEIRTDQACSTNDP